MSSVAAPCGRARLNGNRFVFVNKKKLKLTKKNHRSPLSGTKFHIPSTYWKKKHSSPLDGKKLIYLQLNKRYHTSPLNQIAYHASPLNKKNAPRLST